MHDGIKMILRDILGRSTLDYGLDFRFFVEIIDIFFAIDQYQLFSGYEIVEQNDLIVMSFETIVLLDIVVKVDDLRTKLWLDLA